MNASASAAPAAVRVEPAASEACPGVGAESAADRRILAASRAYASASDTRALFQVAVCVASYAALVVTVRWLGPSPLRLLLVLPLSGILVRTFVLQHDCGHASLFQKKSVNDLCGYFLSMFCGVAYEAWRTEHNWHHNNQAKLGRRGVDSMNSPMTVVEARSRPSDARLRSRTISAVNVFFLGAISLLVMRKRASGFFQFRPKYRWPVHNRDAIIRSLWITTTSYCALQGLLCFYLGPATWALVLLPALMIGAGIGSLLFWVQHNFERTYQSHDDTWSYTRTAVDGSSFLRLNPVFTWFTGSIGLHHVHHLNPRIPNYRLEAARTGIPELSAIPALSRVDLSRSFTHVFWDESTRRMRPLAEVDARVNPPN